MTPHRDGPAATPPGATPRVLLFTGKGGVGKSTLAAGTAALAAAGGRRTLLLSTDAAHSLADAFATPVGAEPTPVADRLWVQQVDTQLRFEQSWAEIQTYLRSVLDVAGVDPVVAEELTVVPGAEEVFALLELRRQAESGAWDLVVVDCAPTAETLRLLALPEALGWYMHRLFGVQRTVVSVLRPVLTRAAGVPMPGDAVFAAVERLHRDLEAVRALLAGPQAAVRLVLTPERVVLAEARRSLTTLALYGFRVDGVVANRVFPDAPDAQDNPWQSGWVEAQRRVLADVSASFGPLPVWRGPYRAAEPVGEAALREMAAVVYDGADPLGGPGQDGPGSFRVSQAGEGALLQLALPGVQRRDVDLVRHGDDLVVTVGGYRRLLTLPAALARHRVSGARVEAGELQVRFEACSRGTAAPAEPLVRTS